MFDKGRAERKGSALCTVHSGERKERGEGGRSLAMAGDHKLKIEEDLTTRTPLPSLLALRRLGN